jgi:protein involved in polysaccharide export with SLBB domain
MRLPLTKVVFFSLLTLIFTLEITAQTTPSLDNLKSINVDELSDDQIQTFIDKMESSGYSQEQLEALAKAKGMPASQVAKLRQRIKEVKSKKDKKVSDKEDLSRNREKEEEIEEKEPFDFLFAKDSTEQKGLKIFGMEFFSNEYLTFEPSINIATPKNYVIGPGDQVVIDIWGQSEQTYILEVSPEGSILVPSVGPIYLNGFSVERADARIQSRLKSIYSTLGNGTFAQISLGQIRTISVNVVGDVKRPGTYRLSAFGSAFNALYMAGGPNDTGSLRDIQIFRGGQKEAVLDAYEFLIDGGGKNIMLQDQDVLIVKPYVNRVTIDGEVKRPAYYEMIENESLADGLRYAGGFTPKAYQKSISLTRNLANMKTVESVLDGDFDSFTLNSGDEIKIGKIQDRFENRVTINGAVNHPSEFNLDSAMKLSDAIEMADGFRPDVFLERAVIIRKNKDFSLNTISFSPAKVISGEFDIDLWSEDVIEIQSIFDLAEEMTVSIQGQVQDPQEFPYAENMTVEDLIFLANGFKETAAKSFVEVARRVVSAEGNNQVTSKLYNFPISANLELSPEDADFILKPFDLVVIRKSPFYQVQDIVEIEGEVLYPGKYALNTKTERISDLIIRAGGITEDAFIAGGTLIRKTEYFDEGSAALVKRIRIEGLGSADSTAVKGTFAINENESIAIKLDRILSSPRSEDDLILKGGDVLSVPKELQTVRVRGEIYFSSNLVYRSQDNLRNYVAQAGGSTEKAQMKKAYVVYPNGSAEKTSNFLWFKDYPTIEPGAEIIIPRKPERRKLSPGEIISITSGIGTIALIINNLTR